MGDIGDAGTGALARELTDLSEAVRAVAAPPIPTLPAPYRLRPCDPMADAEMISAWMNSPHLVEAWQYAWSAQRWREYLRAQLDGQYSRPLIGESGGTPFVYVEVYRAAKDSIARYYDADPHDVGIHAAIGDVSYLHRGLAPILLPHIVKSVLGAETRCRRVMFDPDARNLPARTVCEAAGGVLLGEHELPRRRMALYAIERPDSAQ